MVNSAKTNAVSTGIMRKLAGNNNPVIQK